MTLPYGSGYAGLCLLQGALVALPWRPRRLTRSWVLGAVLPAAALAGGVALVRGLSGGADALTALAVVAAPALAAAAPFVWRWRLPWLAPPAAAALFLVAWRSEGLPAQGAGTLLIAGACITLAGLVASLAPRAAVAAGLVVLAALDVYLVFGNPQVQPTTLALHLAHPPSLGLPPGAPPLPSLQEARLGGAMMGWLDLLAPALLATVVAGPLRVRLAAAAATTVAALAFAMLFEVTPLLPATVPVLAGLAVGLLARGRGRAPRPLAPRRWRWRSAAHAQGGGG
jgi:hypothetical protein